MLKFSVLLLTLSAVLAFPVHNGMMYYFSSPYASPYYNPYQNSMYLQHRSQPLVAPSGVSSFTLGKSIKSNSYVKGNFQKVIDCV